MSVGTIVQVVGPVVDVEFLRDEVPKINDALTLDGGDLVFYKEGGTIMAGGYPIKSFF